TPCPTRSRWPGRAKDTKRTSSSTRCRRTWRCPRGRSRSARPRATRWWRWAALDDDELNEHVNPEDRGPADGLPRGPRGGARAPRGGTRGREGRVRGDRRALGLREVDAPPPPGRARPADLGPDLGGRPRDLARERQRPYPRPAREDRLRVPALQPAADPDRARQPRDRAPDPGPAPALPDPAARAAGHGGPLPQAPDEAARPLGGGAAEDRDRARARERPRDPPRGRAHRQPRHREQRAHPRPL